jgi:ring-1,2-phenylacetyl-CoA epoxidase subunit PaaE
MMQDSSQQPFITLRIKQIIPEATDARTFILESTDAKSINYIPGQFLTFIFQKPNGEEARRNYSISSSPALIEPLQITVKRIPNGEYSRWLIDRAKEGDELITIGASGFFTLPEDMSLYHQLVFFAAGSGITPVYSLIKTVLVNHPSIKMILIYSNTSPGHAIFYQQLKDLQNRYYDRLQIEFLFSSEKSVLHKRLGIYLLEKFLKRYITGSLDKQLFYLCGPFEYMRMITIVLRNNGVADNNIRKEIFNIEKPARKAEPSDKDVHGVTLVLGGKEYQFDSQYPQTILQAAKALKIPVPYSCESGQCGTCAATCTTGEVWMWHNEVLMDDEMAAGRVLTCTGYPVNGDIKLSF